MRQLAVVLTCEHGGYQVPGRYRRLFAGARADLTSHRGWDPGAAALATTFCRRLDAPLHVTRISRLLIEANRSLGHRQLFSEYSRPLAPAEKADVIANYYQPYRTRVVTEIAGHIAAHRHVLHVSVHSFTPQLHGVVRRADIGLLYDPRRASERAWSAVWRTKIRESRAELIVRRNYPYQGKADGFTTFLRRQFASDQYAGIEIEVNQRWVLTDKAAWRKLQQVLARSLADVCSAHSAGF